MKKAEIVKIITFVILASVGIWYSSVVLGTKIGSQGFVREKANAFKNEPENSLDVLFIGSSATDRYWIPSLGWEEAGITSFDLTADGCPVNVMKYMIQEALETQDPEIIFLELRRFSKDNSFRYEKGVRVTTNNYLRFDTRKEAIDSTFRYCERYLGDESNIDTTDISYYYKYWVSHNRWKNGFKLSYLWNLYPTLDQRGYYSFSSSNVWTSRPLDEIDFLDDRLELSDSNKEAIDELLDYCDTLDCKVIFLATPARYTEEEYGKVNAAKDMIAGRGYTTLDLNNAESFEEIGLDISTDYYNDHHVNFLGAVKTSKYLVKYLSENYDIDNHKEDAAYQEAWADCYENLKGIVKKKKPEWLSVL